MIKTKNTLGKSKLTCTNTPLGRPGEQKIKEEPADGSTDPNEHVFDIDRTQSWAPNWKTMCSMRSNPIELIG